MAIYNAANFNWGVEEGTDSIVFWTNSAAADSQVKFFLCPSDLDRLTNPQGLVPGVKMFFALPGAQDRADVIAYLAEQR